MVHDHMAQQEVDEGLNIFRRITLDMVVMW